MFRPVRMKRFTIATLQRDEDKITNILGKIGVVELTKERSEIGREIEEVEEYNKYLRNIDRMKGLLANLEGYLELDVKKRKEYPSLLLFKDITSEVMSGEKIIQHIKETELATNNYVNIADKFTKRLEEIRKLLKDLYYFEKNKIGLDIPGEYTHIFVKTGFIPSVNIPKLKHFLEPFDAIYTILEGRPRENLIIIAGSNKDKREIERALTLLNFDEFIPPEGAEQEPSEEIKKLREEEGKIIEDMRKLYVEIINFLNRNIRKTKYIKFLRDAKSALLRTKNLTIFDGWIPEEMVNKLKESVSKATKERALIHIRDPEEHEKPPTYIKHPSILEKISFLTYKQGIPDYHELNPTPIYIVLFAIMYGMMFGDIGQGAILFTIGVLLTRVKRPMLGISAAGINKLGTLLSISAISSMIFGLLYGEFLLIHIMHPLWLNPIKDIINIVIVAIIFGIFQITLGIILYIINLIARREYLHAIFNWKGVIGLIYYIIGVYVAIKFLQTGASFSIFIHPSILPFTIALLTLLGLMFLSPTIINIIEGKGEPISYTLMMGVSELVEGLLSYITNSISYVRLAAFAVAHVALGEMASVLAYSAGPITSYILINILVIILEGFAAGVQSLRLIYYEFSTKFFMGGGKRFKPLKI